jgi:hypothetical protein
MEYQNSRYTWTGLQRAIERGNVYDQYSRNIWDCAWSSRARPAIEVHALRFEHDTMVMRAQYLDSIAVVGGAVDHTNSAGWHKRFRRAIQSWRETILARYTPAAIYQTPEEFRGARTFGPPFEDTWSTTWLKMLCAGYIPDLDRKFLKFSGADIAMVAQKAASYSMCFFNLGHLDHHRAELFIRHPADRGGSQLYQQFINFMPRVLEGKRMVITRNGFLGFENMNTRMGDKLYLPTTCNAPLILHMAHATASTDRQTHIIVGGCYMQGFMDGICQDLRIPEEELYVV